IAEDAREHGAEIRTGARVVRILVEGSRSVGVALVDGTELRSRAVVSNAHPKITFCELVDSSQLPSDFVRAIDRYKSRSGTVKVNLALGELPRFDGLESEDSMTAAPSSDGVIPTVVDDSLAPSGKQLMSCFTQYVPASWSQAPHRDELEAYADRVVEGYARFAPNLKSA